MRRQTTAQPIMLMACGAMAMVIRVELKVFYAIISVLVCFVVTACEILSNQSGPPPWQ